ncbi:hypothetical protein [Serratia fonticola]|uniref:hypothetical protein n=1 Tax=Serratia fonticola TaxID=47917 RepID=UPI0021AE104F|nr:hypothetical protein [Serratia fonticola]
MNRITRRKIQEEKTSRTKPVVEHITMLRFSWLLGIFGYILMGCIVLLALLGVFSNGVLSENEIISNDASLKVNFDRFVRNGTQTQWEIQIKSRSNKPVSLSVSPEVIDYYVMENIQPQSVLVTYLKDEVIFTIPSGGEKKWHAFSLVLRPKQWGGFRARIGEQGGEHIVIKQWIYP